MSDETTFWVEVWRSVAANSAIAAAGWGALGGATSALAVGGSSRKAMIRQITLGGLVAGGTGTMAISLVASAMGLDATLIPIIGAASSASYFAGVFGPAMIEAALTRMNAATKKGDGSDAT